MRPRFLNFSSTVPRWPLSKWEGVVSPVAKKRPRDATLESWCLANNHYALISLHRGDLKTAAQRCTSQITRLLHGQDKRRLSRNVEIYCVQPLVNLIRLSQHRNQSRTFEVLAMDAPNIGQVIGEIPLESELARRVVQAARCDAKVVAFLRNLSAAALATTAISKLDECDLNRAIALSNGSLREELVFLSDLFQPSHRTGGDRSSLNILISAFHLYSLGDKPTQADDQLAYNISSGLLKRAFQTGNAFDLEAAISVLTKCLAATEGDHERHTMMFQSISQQARNMDDEVAQIKLGKLAVQYLGHSRSALAAMVGKSEYACVSKNFTV